MYDQVPNADLRVEGVPGPNAEWSEIARFALTFDGYAHWGSFDRCAEIANAPRKPPEMLTELRTRLFFEQRRWRHYGYSPDEEALKYIRGLVDEIRTRVVEIES